MLKFERSDLCSDGRKEIRVSPAFMKVLEALRPIVRSRAGRYSTPNDTEIIRYAVAELAIKNKIMSEDYRNRI